MSLNVEHDEHVRCLMCGNPWGVPTPRQAIAAQVCRQAGLVEGESAKDHSAQNFSVGFGAMDVNMETAHFFRKDFEENRSMEIVMLLSCVALTLVG